MNEHDIIELRQSLAELANSQQTSHALRTFLLSALQRDIVDVANKVQVLGRIARNIDFGREGRL